MARKLARRAGRFALSGETDLARLCADLRPELHDRPYDYVPITGTEPPPAHWLALVREREGLAAVAPLGDGRFARITLNVHSSLEAVGLTAAVSTALTAAGISANMIAGQFHDHLLVPWERRHDAVAILEALGER